MSKPFIIGCPWCNEFPTPVDGDIDGWSYACTNEDCEVQPYTQDFITEEAARQAWNKRKRPTMSEETYQKIVVLATCLIDEAGLKESARGILDGLRADGMIAEVVS